MATVLSEPRRPEHYEPRVHGPLDRLRGFIRLYVGTEVLASLAVFLAAWYWLGVILDYGLFRVFNIDWVQEVPWRPVRAMQLGFLLAALPVALLVRLMFRRLGMSFSGAFLWLLGCGFYVALWLAMGYLLASQDLSLVVGICGTLVLVAGVFFTFLGKILAATEQRRHVESVAQQLGRIPWYINLGIVLAAPAYLFFWYGVGQLVASRSIPGTTVVFIGGTLLAAMMVAVVLARLIFKFRPSALALVLERRYPDLLGDRLITAVELADPQLARQYGYSQPMVDQTIEEAIERVAKIPLKGVFNLKRLVRFGWAILALTIGMFLAGFVVYGLYWIISTYLMTDELLIDETYAILLPVIAGAALGLSIFLRLLKVARGFVSIVAKDDETAVQASQPGFGSFLLRLAVVAAPTIVLAGTAILLLSMPGLMAKYCTRLGMVSELWFERNILLANHIWPRQAQLELIGFPESGELKVGKNSPSVHLRVRALKWVMADENAPEGWRALTWKDIEEDYGNLGISRPQPLPEAWLKENASWTVDQVQLRLDNVKGKVLQAEAAKFRQTLAELHELARQPEMARRLRELTIPETITVSSWGTGVRNEMNPKKESGNEYTVAFTNLKSSVYFRVKALDYATGTKMIRVVDPPAITNLSRQDDQPAYLSHYPPLRGKASDLKGLKQQFAEENVFLGGDTSRIDVPLGTDIRLRAQTDKELSRGELRVQGALNAVDLAAFRSASKQSVDSFLLEALAKTRKLQTLDLDAMARENRTLVPVLDLLRKHYGKSKIQLDQAGLDLITDANYNRFVRELVKKGLEAKELPALPLAVKEGDKTFAIRFVNVTGLLDFEFQFTDTDGVIGRRRVVIQAQEDRKPEVEVFVDALRKTSEGTYLITPVARIPFSGRIEDDHGLAKVDYFYTYVLDKAAGEENYFWWTDAGDEGERASDGISLATFAAKAQRRARVDQQTLMAQLKNGNRRLPRLLSDKLEVNPDKEAFDVRQQLPQLKVSEDKVIQPRYRLRLWLAATDNNVETGPGVAESKERYAFQVVSEFELLSKVGEEEAGFHQKLNQMIEKLLDAKLKLRQLNKDLDDPNFNAAKDFKAQVLRTQEIIEALNGSSIVATEVLGEYNRILKELDLNRVSPGYIKRVKLITTPLGQALSAEFLRAEAAQRTLQQSLEASKKDLISAKRAEDRFQELLDRLDEVQRAIGEIISINEAVKSLTNITDDELKQVEELRKLKNKIDEENIKQLIGDEKPDKKP